jgi:hypothetical protein
MCPVYHPGVNHGHKPSGKWSDIQDNPNSSFLVNRVCKHWSPRSVIDIAVWKEFTDKPIATEHLQWYLFKGKGTDFVEDKYIEKMLRTDQGVQSAIVSHAPATSGGKFASFFKLEQSDYDDEDFQYAFGAIDRLDFEVDYAADTLHAWFQDRYEWHPYYPGIYDVQPDDAPGGVVRETNCVHAAMVELKSVGAADFWMKGEATVPWSVVKKGAASGRNNSTI